MLMSSWKGFVPKISPYLSITTNKNLWFFITVFLVDFVCCPFAFISTRRLDLFANHLHNMVFHLAGFKIPRSIRMLTQFGGDALLPSIVKGRLVRVVIVHYTKELLMDTIRVFVLFQQIYRTSCFEACCGRYQKESSYWGNVWRVRAQWRYFS